MNIIDLHGTIDARLWAKEFVRINGGDEEMMIGWFANAIMAGHDYGKGPLNGDHAQFLIDKATPAPGEPKEGFCSCDYPCSTGQGDEERCSGCGLLVNRPVAANKTMGREFARVEGDFIWFGDCRMPVWRPKGEICDMVNKAHAQAVESAVKELKAERDGLAYALRELVTRISNSQKHHHGDHNVYHAQIGEEELIHYRGCLDALAPKGGA